MHKKKSSIKIALLCSNNIFRESLRIYLSSKTDLTVTGDYHDTDSLTNALNPYSFDVLIMDFVLSKEDNDGLNMINIMIRRNPELKILSLSSFYCAQTAILALRNGAKGFIETRQNLSELIRALKIIASGRIYLSKEITNKIPTSHSKTNYLIHKEDGYIASDISNLTNKFLLTPKELEVARCLAQGLCLSEIATKHSRSIKTISGQKRSIMHKLGAKSTHDLLYLISRI